MCFVFLRIFFFLLFLQGGHKLTKYVRIHMTYAMEMKNLEENFLCVLVKTQNEATVTGPSRFDEFTDSLRFLSSKETASTNDWMDWTRIYPKGKNRSHIFFLSLSFTCK